MSEQRHVNEPDREAYRRSLDHLRRCLSPAGFLASPNQVDNYARVWARDGVIDGLAALVSGEDDLIAGMERTLITLATYQGPHGEIPSNVTVDGTNVSYGRLSGRVDALLWYVIGVCAYVHYVDDINVRDLHRASVESALFLAGCWEYNNRGLIYTPVAGNWADEYIQQGYVLSDELLYMLALRSAGEVFEREQWLEKAALLKKIIEINYWPLPALHEDELAYHPYAYAYQFKQGPCKHWLPAFSPNGYDTYFDGLAHALTLITDIGSDEQREQAEAYVQALEQEIGSALLPAFWPVIAPGDAKWPLLQENHLYGIMKNQPYMYHNGGLWPVLTGMYILGLVHQREQRRAEHVLAALNAANAQPMDGENWAFAEYHHGQKHTALGTRHLAWSAAAGVLGYQAVWYATTPWPL